MGCTEVSAIEDMKGQEKSNTIGNPTEPNLAEKMVSGIVQPFGDKTFKDCIINNESEFDDKIVDFIPTKIPDPENDDNEIPNINDDIVTQSLKVDFNINCIIALSGIHKVLKVERHNDNYLVFHDGQKGKKNTYIAIVVQKIIGGFPTIEFNPPKLGK
jgi:hypothetical protein